MRLPNFLAKNNKKNYPILFGIVEPYSYLCIVYLKQCIMKTTFVYRIEHTDKSAINIGTDRKIKGVNRGPYVNRGKSKLLSEMSNAHNNDYTHPSVRDDIDEWWSDDFNPYKYVCCFKTKKQVKTWFDGWFEVLHSEGYVLVKYTINEDGLIMGRSKKQGVFNPKKIIKRKVVGNLDVIK